MTVFTTKGAIAYAAYVEALVELGQRPKPWGQLPHAERLGWESGAMAAILATKPDELKQIETSQRRRTSTSGRFGRCSQNF